MLLYYIKYVNLCLIFIVLFNYLCKKSLIYIMIIIGAFTIFVYYNQKDNIELYFNSITNSNDNIITERNIEIESNKIHKKYIE